MSTLKLNCRENKLKKTGLDKKPLQDVLTEKNTLWIFFKSFQGRTWTVLNATKNFLIRRRYCEDTKNGNKIQN